MCLVSVIVPVFNVVDYLSECVESLLNQTLSDIEVILVDDGSTDGSSALCDKYASIDSRVQAVHKKNGGISSARNLGMRMAKGVYLTFLDSDDYYSADALRIMYDVATETTNAAVVSCGVNKVENGQVSPYRSKWHRESARISTPEEFIRGMLEFSISNTVWNKLYDRGLCAGIEFIEGRLNEDTVFNYSVARRMNQEQVIIEIPDYLYYYRMNPNGITHSKRDRLLIDEVENYKLIMDSSRATSLEEFTQSKYINALVSMVNVLSASDSFMKIPKDSLDEFDKISIIYLLKTTGVKNVVSFIMLKLRVKRLS